MSVRPKFDFAEAGQLTVVAREAVEVRVAHRQNRAAIRVLRRAEVVGNGRSDQRVEHRIRHRIVNFLEAELAIEGVEAADRPFQACGGIVGLKPDFLRDVALLVGHSRRRAVVRQSGRQVYARSVEQRVQARSYGRGIMPWSDNGLIVAQIVERAVVAADLVAMEVGGRRNQGDRSDVRLHIQRGQIEIVGLLTCRGIRADILVLARIRVLGPVDRHVVARAVLIEHAGRDLEVIVRLPQGGEMQHRRVVFVRIRIHDRQ